MNYDLVARVHRASPRIGTPPFIKHTFVFGFPSFFSSATLGRSFPFPTPISTPFGPPRIEDHDRSDVVLVH
jgi:hypothetical protein